MMVEEVVTGVDEEEEKGKTKSEKRRRRRRRREKEREREKEEEEKESKLGGTRGTLAMMEKRVNSSPWNSQRTWTFFPFFERKERPLSLRKMLERE